MSAIFGDALEAKIDFHGQALVELIAKAWLVVAAVVSFVVGWWFQSLRLTLVAYGASTLILAVVVLPPWPMYNKHPVKWLPVKEKPKNE
ncbi:microsomal signal peptidase 12 kDa subunit [Cylindrobasidium torrendii FP15055 ss-10]|uniref:Signal peptidase complex subunit 1 n=1 Tax=Cylindrobasidium torrendii FP15055 ss-10 TaxID=1314674 RepID=A0A0D7BJ72_9AGAR|nr:microsomal signal peptidase 12 kDa subunit [Cylindrobasidium torrendii FP15055 ss-10]